MGFPYDGGHAEPDPMADCVGALNRYAENAITSKSDAQPATTVLIKRVEMANEQLSNALGSLRALGDRLLGDADQSEKKGHAYASKFGGSVAAIDCALSHQSALIADIQDEIRRLQQL